MNALLSPRATATAAGRKILGPIEFELRHFGRQYAGPWRDADAAYQIEDEFGERLEREVAVPHNLMMCECLSLALVVAKEAYRELTRQHAAHGCDPSSHRYL